MPETTTTDHSVTSYLRSLMSSYMIPLINADLLTEQGTSKKTKIISYFSPCSGWSCLEESHRVVSQNIIFQLKQLQNNMHSLPSEECSSWSGQESFSRDKNHFLIHLCCMRIVKDWTHAQSWAFQLWILSCYSSKSSKQNSEDCKACVLLEMCTVT